jgi:hypothetical protein
MTVASGHETHAQLKLIAQWPSLYALSSGCPCALLVLKCGPELLWTQTSDSLLLPSQGAKRSPLLHSLQICDIPRPDEPVL